MPLTKQYVVSNTLFHIQEMDRAEKSKVQPSSRRSGLKKHLTLNDQPNNIAKIKTQETPKSPVAANIEQENIYTSILSCHVIRYYKIITLSYVYVQYGILEYTYMYATKIYMAYIHYYMHS